MAAMTADPHPVAEQERVVGADRVVAVLIELAEHPLGVALDEIASRLNSPKPTVHRALATLRRAGLADLVGRGSYVLGDEFLRLAFRNHAGRPEAARIQPLLEELSMRFGETAHYAVLSGTEVVYRAKADPPAGAVRLTSVVGGRNPAYRTAVGKALMSDRLRSRDDLERWLDGGGLEPRTSRTISTLDGLEEELERTRRRGYAVDDEENEVGIACVAVPVLLDGSATVVGAISVSAVAFRTPLAQLAESIPSIRETIVAYLGASSVVSAGGT